MRNILLCSLVLALLSACSLHANPHNARINLPGGSIEIEGDNTHQGKFCPPGQAKKGRC